MCFYGYFLMFWLKSMILHFMRNFTDSTSTRSQRQRVMKMSCVVLYVVDKSRRQQDSGSTQRKEYCPVQLILIGPSFFKCMSLLLSLITLRRLLFLYPQRKILTN